MNYHDRVATFAESSAASATTCILHRWIQCWTTVDVHPEHAYLPYTAHIVPIAKGTRLQLEHANSVGQKGPFSAYLGSIMKMADVDEYGFGWVFSPATPGVCTMVVLRGHHRHQALGVSGHVARRMR